MPLKIKRYVLQLFGVLPSSTPTFTQVGVLHFAALHIQSQK